MKTVHGVDFYAQGGHKKHKGNEHDEMEERRWGMMEGGCHPNMSPMTPNSNGSGSPKIKTEVRIEITLAGHWGNTDKQTPQCADKYESNVSCFSCLCLRGVTPTTRTTPCPWQAWVTTGATTTFPSATTMSAQPTMPWTQGIGNCPEKRRTSM